MCADQGKRQDGDITTVVGTYGFFEDLRRHPPVVAGRVVSFNDSYVPIHDAFRPMVETQCFDICEMAIATYVQARAAGIPITMLPVSVFGRFQHEQLQVLPSSRLAKPKEIEGKRVGARSYSLTTGMWVRAFLRTQYQVDLSQVEWVVFEEPHVRGLPVPGNVKMAEAGLAMAEMLADGDLDAAIGAGRLGVSGVVPLVRDAGRAAHEWYEAYGVLPVNHVLTVTENFLLEAPDAVRGVYEIFRSAVRNRASDPAPRPAGAQWAWLDGLDLVPTGTDRMVEVAQGASAEACAQGLIPEPLAEDQLMHPIVRGWE